MERFRESDVNFSDVFGGPPRRSSMYEMRQRRGDDNEDDETELPYRGSLTGMRDKPVFGEDSANRRQKGNDIFRAYEPREKQDPFSGISHFSLPAKVMDLPTFGPPTRSSTSYSYSPTPTPSLSLFSRQSSHGLSQEGQPEKANKGSHALKGPEVSGDASQFHFSIYKWATKGVPLMGSNSWRSKQMGRTGSKGSISTENATPHGFDKPSFSGMDGNNKENDSLLSSRAESSHMDLEEVVGVSADIVLDSTRVKVKHDSHLKLDSGGKGKKEALNTTLVVRPFKSDDLKPLLNDKSNDDTALKAGGSRGMNESNKNVSLEKIGATEKVKKLEEKHNALANKVVDRAGLEGLPRKSGSNLGRNKIEGRVGEFAKKFNQEVSSKPKTDVVSQSQSSRQKVTFRPEKESSLDAAGMDQKLQFNPNKETTLEHESMKELNKVEECLKQSDKHYSTAKTKTENYISSCTSSKPKNASVSSTVPDVSKTVGDTDEPLQRASVMKELALEKNDKPQPGKDHEDMQAVDAKIRKWSNGKEGNIRSLLSTLQYILWPESGWKPVPLVDIIEGNAVKRAYQKALLRLHPDKLQQKGAASHHKYIAEKVFDILQEAWTQFNLLGSL